MIKEFCDKCGGEFKYPILRGGRVKFRSDGSYEDFEMTFCINCYNKLAWSVGAPDSFGESAPEPPSIESEHIVNDPDDALMEEYNKTIERALMNDEPDGIPI